MANFYGSLIGFGAGGAGFVGMEADETAQTGLTISTDGDYKVFKYTQSGTFTPTTLGDLGTVEYLVVAGGGGGA